MVELQHWAATGTLGDDRSLRRYAQRKLATSTNKNKDTPQHAAFAAIDAALEAQHAAEALKPLILAHAVPWVAARLEAAKQRLAQRSEEHTSELQSLMRTSYAVFCLK